MRSLALALAVALLASGVAARADGPAPAYIDWQPSLVVAFESAKKAKKPVFIAINAERVDGKARLEPAAKELRENTYLDPAVVKKSREFVCALVKPDANSADYAELRSHFAIDGIVVSPQHIFAHADGALIDRKEYWPYGTGSASVEALLKLMDAALEAHRARLNLGTPGATGTPEEQRAAWILARVEKVRAGAADPAACEAAVGELVRGDRKGDCVAALCAVLGEPKRDAETKTAILRGLGKPGLESAVPAIVAMLDDTSEDVRANAAITLEYVGSATAIEPLTKRLGKEADDLVRNDCCRALGRCGAKQEAVRKTLLREFATTKSNKASAGPAIGLTYFEKDAEAARGIEKVLAPGVDWQRRAFGLYALTLIRDGKSAEFVRTKVLKSEKNQEALQFLNAVVRVLEGSDADGEGLRGVNRGVEGAISTLGDIGGAPRRGRDQTQFIPNGEFAAPSGRRR